MGRQGNIFACPWGNRAGIDRRALPDHILISGRNRIWHGRRLPETRFSRMIDAQGAAKVTESSGMRPELQLELVACCSDGTRGRPIPQGVREAVHDLRDLLRNALRT